MDITALDLSNEQIDEIENSWKWRCLQWAKRGGHNSVYLILRAMHRGPREQTGQKDILWPRLGNACHIRADGVVTAMYQGAPTEPSRETNVGTVTQIRDALRRMADQLKLNDMDRVALFAAFSGWIEKDARATSET
jgi:hypothetical protein